MDALKQVNDRRKKNDVAPLDKSSVYRFLKGSTHKRGRIETRGRRKSVTKADVRKLDRSRVKLIKKAKGEKRVTWADVISDAGYEDVCSERAIQDAMLEEGVRFRAARAKVYVSEDDAKTRLDVGRQWLKRPKSYWSDKVHAYVDNKPFPAPLTPKQRAKFRQTRVTGHLRKPGEGISMGVHETAVIALLAGLSVRACERSRRER